MKREIQQLLLGCAFAEPIQASSAEGLLDAVSPILPSKSWDPLHPGPWFDLATECLRTERAAKTIGLPLAELVARDMKGVLGRAAQSLDAGGFRTLDVDDLASDLQQYCRILGELGLPVVPPELFSVKRFPKPYQHQAHWALTVDAQDASEYGIAAGIYFRQAMLMPFASTALLAHELTHVLLSSRPSVRLVRGLEEGVADVLAFLLLKKRYDERTALALTRNFRLYHPLEPIGWAYLHALKSACYLLSRVGLRRFAGFVAKAVRDGREIIERSEEQLLIEATIHEDDYPEGEFELPEADGASAQRFAAFVLNFTQGYVVSPLARYVAEHCEVGINVKTIAQRAALSRAMVRRGLGELEERLYLVILDGDRVIANESDVYAKATSLRYEPPGK